MSRSDDSVTVAIEALAACGAAAATGVWTSDDGADGAALAEDVGAEALTGGFDGGGGNSARNPTTTTKDKTTAKRTRFSIDNSQCRRGGTGSKPNEPSGWQRASRRRPSQTPLPTPWVRMASAMYVEQDG